MTNHNPTPPSGGGNPETSIQRTPAGCLLMLLCLGLVIGGVVIAMVFNPEVKVAEVPIDGEAGTFMITGTVSPETYNRIEVEMHLQGHKHYGFRVPMSTKAKDRMRQPELVTHTLAYEVPIRIVVTRLGDNTTILEYKHQFDLSNKKGRLMDPQTSESETYGMVVRDFPEIPVQEQAEELRVEMTVGKDTVHGSWVKDGALKITQKPSSAPRSLGILVTILGVLGIGLGVGLLLIKPALAAVASRRRKARS